MAQQGVRETNACYFWSSGRLKPPRRFIYCRYSRLASLRAAPVAAPCRLSSTGLPLVESKPPKPSSIRICSSSLSCGVSGAGGAGVGADAALLPLFASLWKSVGFLAVFSWERERERERETERRRRRSRGLALRLRLRLWRRLRLRLRLRRLLQWLDFLPLCGRLERERERDADDLDEEEEEDAEELARSRPRLLRRLRRPRLSSEELRSRIFGLFMPTRQSRVFGRYATTEVELSCNKGVPPKINHQVTVGCSMRGILSDTFIFPHHRLRRRDARRRMSDAADHVVSSEEELLQSAPQPHERVFYWGSGSPQAWRVLIALEEKGLPYRSVCVSFQSGVLKSPYFQALNLRMRVPVLVEPLDDPLENADANSLASSPTTPIPYIARGGYQERTVLYESAAILEYLERRYPARQCMPRDFHGFAIAQTRMHEANEILSVVGDLVVYLRRFPNDKRNPAVVQAKWAALEKELSIWEQYLDGRPYLVSREVPYLCDFTLFTNVAYAVRCGLQLDGLYPRLAMFYVRLCARPSVETTWPPHWKATFGTKVLTKCFYCAGQAACSCCQPQDSAPSSTSPATSASS